MRDACEIHDFNDVEQARIEVLAEQLNQVLLENKERLKREIQRL